MLGLAILSLIGEHDIPHDGIEAALHEILQFSLWHRWLQRQNATVQQALKGAFLSRSRLIWGQSTTTRRRGYFLADVGLKTGHELDAIASDANRLLVQGNGAILQDNPEAVIAPIAGLVERVFAFHPFTRAPLPLNWREILRASLLGQPLAALGEGLSTETLPFVEGEPGYRLPWALGTIRVRARANGETIEPFDIAFEDHDLCLAVSAIETGTLNRSASVLTQAEALLQNSDFGRFTS